MEKEITELTKIRREFPNKKFLSADMKTAGKLLKVKGPDAVRDFLNSCQEIIGDFKPPVKTNIVSISRPFEEWPVSMVGRAIQEYYFSLTKEELESVHPGTSSEDHKSFFNITGLSNYNYTSVQGLNLIFKNAKAIYDGTLVKANNKNKKLEKKFNEINHKRSLEGLPIITPDFEEPFDENGHLNNPPGINRNIYGYQGCAAKVFVPSKHKMVSLPKEYEGYNRDPNLSLAGFRNRLEIPEGEPGHVPWFQRMDIPEGQIGHVNKIQRFNFVHGKNSGKVKFSDKTGRVKRYHHSKYKDATKPYKFLEESKKVSALDSILAIITIGDDWVVFDIRGLYRNVFYRELAQKGLTAVQLLDLFTGDPVIDPKKGIITFSYKEGVVPVFSQKIVSRFKSRDTLEKLTSQGPVALLSVDLGQNEPVAARVCSLKNINDKIALDNSCRIPFLDDYKKQIKDYRDSLDELEIKIRLEAINSLDVNQQVEIRDLDVFSADRAKASTVDMFDIDPNLISWDSMSDARFSTQISDLYLKNGGDESRVYFEINNKRIKRSDYNISQLVRPKLSDSTRKNLNDSIWKLKRTSEEYLKLSKRKLELSRAVVNYTIRQSKLLSGINDIVIILEDLDVKKKFNGRGIRDIGWDNFFSSRKENRWFIPAFHKSFSELSSNRGLCVIEVNPAWTSATCPDCGFCSKENRDGINFTCRKCGVSYHADIDVATLNIARVAVLGKPMSGPADRERLGGTKKPRVARSRKDMKRKDISNGTVEVMVTA